MEHKAPHPHVILPPPPFSSSQLVNKERSFSHLSKEIVTVSRLCDDKLLWKLRQDCFSPTVNYVFVSYISIKCFESVFFWSTPEHFPSHFVFSIRIFITQSEGYLFIWSKNLFSLFKLKLMTCIPWSEEEMAAAPQEDSCKHLHDWKRFLVKGSVH